MVSHQELALGWRAQLSAINNIADVHKFVTAESDKLDCRPKAGSEASIYLQAEFSRRKRQLGQVPSAKENNQPAGANADMGRMAPGKRPLADGDQLREACAGRNADPFQVRNAVHNRERSGSGAVERDVAVRPRAAPPSAVAVDIVVLSDDEEEWRKRRWR
jgi:hypothetical protein